MFTVSDSIHVNAPIDRCFLLSTHVGLASLTLQMKPVSGKTAGTLGPGERVIFAGWRFGLPHAHEVAITRYDRPGSLESSIRRGRLTRYQYSHQFIEIDGQTLIIDKLRFSLPFGWIGKKLARQLVLPAAAALVRKRLELLKQVAESGQWRLYLSEEPSEQPSADQEFAIQQLRKA